MPIRFVFLWTDVLIYILVALTIVFVVWARTNAYVRESWRQVTRRKLAMAAFVVLGIYVAIGLLDTVHFRRALPAVNQEKLIHYSGDVESFLDVLISPMGDRTERTYSAPLATQHYGKSGESIRLGYGGAHLKNPEQEKWSDIFHAVLNSAIIGIIFWAVILMGMMMWLKIRNRCRYFVLAQQILLGQTWVAWREILLTLLIALVVISVALKLGENYFIFGTDKVGVDVLYQSIKSVRTGLVIGTLTTLLMMPFAIVFGIAAGYFGGWVDDIIQYIYTTLSSVPAVLLIVATMLSLQVVIFNHPEWFPTMAAQADARLFALCAILGVTSWTGLCRLLRGETLKIREIEYVGASKVLGASHLRILMRHVLPNVFHIVIITLVLDFSGLVLAEAVLSYVGVGVDPTTLSWGTMINSARLELAREPIVWWPLLAAFLLMFILVLSANLFADAVRDAFDPRLRGVK